MNDVILDSWTFQSVGELFADGYDHEQTGALVATDLSHEFIPIAYGEVQLQALIDLLTHVVLRDRLKLDRQFIESWATHVECFRPVSDAGLILVTTPIVEASLVKEHRQRIVRDLCVTNSLRAVQEENERSFAANQQTTKPFESQIIWGGAGMLARSIDQRLPYVGHPLRQRFIESTKAWRQPPDPTGTVIDLVNDHKASIYSTFTRDGQDTRAKLILPSVAVEVITKAGTPDHLFPVALELRNKYKDLRKWLGEMRIAIEEENTAKLMGYKKVLNALARDVARASGGGDEASSSLDIALSSVTVEPTVGLAGTLRGLHDMYVRRFTVRHDLMNMVKAPAGLKAMKKLEAMFGKH